MTAGALAPRQSSDLAHSILEFTTRNGAGIGSTLPYAGVVHWGGTIEPRGIPITFRPALFVSRAVDDHMEELLDAVGDGIERAADRTGWH